MQGEGFGSALGGFSLSAAVVYLLLLVPDFLLRQAGYTLDGQSRPKAFLIVGIIAVALSSIASRKTRLCGASDSSF